MVHKLALKTILTLNPTAFKKACAQYKDAVEQVKVTREQYDSKADIEWESLVEKRCVAMWTTSKEAAVMAQVAKYKDSKDELQSKCKTEKRTGERNKPNSWESVHALIKGYATKASDLMPIV